MKTFKKLTTSIADLLSVDRGAVWVLFLIGTLGTILTIVGLQRGNVADLQITCVPQDTYTQVFLLGIGTLVLTFLIYLCSLRDSEHKAFIFGIILSFLLHFAFFFTFADTIVGTQPDFARLYELEEEQKHEREVALNLTQVAPVLVSDYFYGDLPGDEIFQDETENDAETNDTTGIETDRPDTGMPTVSNQSMGALRDEMERSDEVLNTLEESVNTQSESQNEVRKVAESIAPTHAEIPDAERLKRQRELAQDNMKAWQNADGKSFQEREMLGQNLSTQGLMGANTPTIAEAGKGIPEIISAKSAFVKKVNPRQVARERLRIADAKSTDTNDETARGVRHFPNNEEMEKEVKSLLTGTVDGVSDAVLNQSSVAEMRDLGTVLESDHRNTLKNTAVFSFQNLGVPEMGFRPGSMLEMNGEDGENMEVLRPWMVQDDDDDQSLAPQMANRPTMQNLLENQIELLPKASLPYRHRMRMNHRQLIEKAGGDPASEQMVELGLQYLERSQFADGHWSLNFLPNKLPKGMTQKEVGMGTIHADTAATGLALLTYLGAGYTHLNTAEAEKAGEKSDFIQTVNRGLNWLLQNQQADGSLFRPETDAHRYGRIYSHGIATIALSEAYGMTHDPRLREPAQRAIDFIINSQAPEGGWRYTPEKNDDTWRSESDTSVSGWQAMALVSARMAGLNVPDEVFRNLKRWVRHASIDGGQRFCYMPVKNPLNSEMEEWRKPTHAMTAEGLLMELYLNDNPKEKNFQLAADFLMESLPNTNSKERNTYYWYYATQVMYHLHDRRWEVWQSHLVNTLRHSQETENDFLRGSWSPTEPSADYWGPLTGRHYVTTLHLLMLEVYYRHLPLFRELSTESLR